MEEKFTVAQGQRLTELNGNPKEMSLTFDTARRKESGIQKIGTDAGQRKQSQTGQPPSKNP